MIDTGSGIKGVNLHPYTPDEHGLSCDTCGLPENSRAHTGGKQTQATHPPTAPTEHTLDLLDAAAGDLATNPRYLELRATFAERLRGTR